MRKSCLVALVLLTAVLLAVSVSLRRCYLATTGGADSGVQTTSQVPDSAPSDLGALTTVEAALRSLDDPGTEGLDGLALETLRPLTAERLRIYGLAASDESLYLAACDSSGLCGYVHRLDGATFTPAGQVRVATDGYSVPGGLLLHNDELWLWNLADGAGDTTQVVVLDRESLQERSRSTLQGAARSLVRMPDGTLRGATGDGNWFYIGASEGGSLRRQANTTGATYTDCELLSGSTVCAGVLENGEGVIDVLGAGDFSLLARHMASARTEGGDRVVGGAWAYWQGRFVFVPENGELPILWSYVLDGITLDQYIPAVEP